MSRAVQLLLKPVVSGSNLVDSAQGTSAALVTNMTTAADSPFGAGESSVTFSNTSSGILSGSYLTSDQYNTHLKSFTIEGWIKHTGSAAGNIFLIKDGTNSSNNLVVSYAADATLSFGCGIGYNTVSRKDTGTSVTSQYDVSDFIIPTYITAFSISASLYSHGVASGWVHYACVLNTDGISKTTATIFINGSVAASIDVPKYIGSDTNYNAVTTGTFYFRGITDGFFIRNSNIGVLYSATATGASFYGLQFTTGAALYTSSFTPPTSGNPLNVLGYGKVYGTVSQGSTPISTLLRCYKVSDGSLVGTTTSASDGTYTFNNLAIGTQYFVVSANNIYQDISSKVVTAVSM